VLLTENDLCFQQCVFVITSLAEQHSLHQTPSLNKNIFEELDQFACIPS